MIGDYTYMAAPEWELSMKKVLWVILVLVIIGATIIVSLFAVKYPKYQAQINNAYVEEQHQEARAMTSEMPQGSYLYVEYVPPNQRWDYHLKIEKNNAATLFIEGPSISSNILAHIEYQGGVYQVIFDSYGIGDNNGMQFGKGQILFHLRPQASEKYRIIWDKLQPVLIDPAIKSEFRRI
jgi:uncharacterized protein YxeA